MDLEPTDCDGKLLDNRQIRFSPGEVAASPDPNNQSGTWTVVDPAFAALGLEIVVAWNLSRQ